MLGHGFEGGEHRIDTDFFHPIQLEYISGRPDELQFDLLNLIRQFEQDVLIVHCRI